MQQSEGSGNSPEEARGSSLELRFLNAKEVRFRHQGSRLEMQRETEDDWQEVSVARLFPLSQPEHWISVLDQKGKEIGILLDLGELPRQHLACVREELSRRYLVPEIRKILSCRQRFDLVEWTVETDRGQAVFLTRDLREQIRQPLPHRVTLTDVQGNRYDVPDITALDILSRRLLEMHL